MQKNKNIDFKFYSNSFDLVKAKDDDGNEIMRIGGIAATEDIDQQDEVLLVEGMSIDNLVGGLANWQHQSLKNPASIVGIISKAEKRKRGLYLECDLFPEHDMSKSVYKLTKMLNKSSSKQKMAFSIEGKAIERDSFNPKRVTKSIISAVAITPTPVNKSTFAQIIKGEVSMDDSLLDPEFEKSEPNGGKTLIVDIVDDSGTRIMVDSDYNLTTEKALTSESGSALIEESVEGSTKKINKSFFINDENVNFTTILEKSQVYDYFLKAIPEITPNASKRLFTTIVALNKTQGSIMPEQITLETLKKAFENLNILSQMDASELEKGSSMQTPNEETQGGKMTTIEKMSSMVEKGCSKEDIMKAMKEDKEENYDEEEMEKMYESNFGKKKDDMKKSEESIEDKLAKAQETLDLLKAEKAKEDEALVKSETLETIEAKSNVEELIKGLQSNFEEKISSFETLIKGVISDNELLKSQSSAKEDELRKAQDVLEKAQSDYNELANEAKKPKSIQTQAFIQKGETPETFGGASEKMSVQNRKAILAKADSFIDYDAIDAGNKLEKAYALSLDKYQFEGQVPQGMIKRFRENGIELVG